jgi:hypothetical protein
MRGQELGTRHGGADASYRDDARQSGAGSGGSEASPAAHLPARIHHHHGEGEHALSPARGDGAGGDGDGLLEGEARDDVTKRHSGPLL